MTIDAKCYICRNPDRARLVELGWNGGMGRSNIARIMDDSGVTVGAIDKHIRNHAEGNPRNRAIDVVPEAPAKDRVYALQKMQLDEVERRIALAKARADQLNDNLDKLADMGAEGADTVQRHDWSEFYDILGKDAQAAIGSILKSQAVTDKRDKAVGELKLGLFEAMASAGLAPQALVGGFAPPQLESGEDEEPDGEPD